MTPRFGHADPPAVSPELRRLPPAQGGLELQHDQPGEIHDRHRHSIDEELFVLDGKVLLFWSADGRYHRRTCAEGTWISLPAGVVHGSVAGRDGSVHMIRPEDGRTAETTFLTPEAHPHPTPRTAEE